MLDIRLLLCSPVFILVVLTGLMYGVNIFVLEQSWRLGHSLFIMGVAVFLATYIIASYVLSFVNIGSLASGSSALCGSSRNAIVLFYWVIAVISLILSGLRIYFVGYLGEQGSLLINLRYSYIYEGGGLYGAQHMSLFGLCLSLFYAQRQEILKTLLSGSVYLVSAISIAEKTSLLLLFVSVTYTLLFMGWIKVRGFIFSILGLLVLFYLITLGRTGSTDISFLFNYFAYGVTAFSDWAEGSDYLGCADLVFGSYLEIFSLGLYSCTPLDLGFSDGDFNVMSYVANPYLYGGVPMLICTMAFLGVCFSFLRFLALRRQGYFLALLSCSIYSLVMVFYAWQFTLTTYFYVFFLLLPLFYGGWTLHSKNN